MRICPLSRFLFAKIKVTKKGSKIRRPERVTTHHLHMYAVSPHYQGCRQEFS